MHEPMQGTIASCLDPRYNRRSLPHTLDNRRPVTPPDLFEAQGDRSRAGRQSMTLSPQ